MAVFIIFCRRIFVMKKLVSLVLALIMVLSVTSALAFSPEEPITITFWHTRGSGANYEVLKASVDGFNATVGKEKGIIVEEIFQGGYADIVSKLQLGSQSGDIPVVSVTSGVRASLLLDDGLLADMAPYAAETGFDFSNIFDSLMNTPGNENGQVHSLPYVRSTPVFYYNETMADAADLSAPETVEDLIAFAKALHKVDSNGEVTTWGFELLNDTTYLQGSFLWSMGAPLVGEGGTAPCLDEGSLLKLFTDWKSWVDEGWCRPFDATNASSTCTQMFYQGKLACFVASCGSLGNIYKFSKDAGFELGVSYYPTYDIDNRAVSIGGGNIILVEGNTDEQLRAGWAFIEYLMQDEQVAAEAIGSGYVPVTKSVETNETMMAFWAENPLFKVAYDQLNWGHCEETPFFLDRTEFKTNVAEATTLLIQEGSITPEEAIEQIKANSAHLF